MNVTKLTLLATLASVLLVNHPLSEATFGTGDDFLEWEQNSTLGQHQLSYVMGLLDAYELGALSLNKTHLAEHCPSVGSERTAATRIADLKSARVLIEYLIRDAALYSVKYKVSGGGAKKPSEAWVFDEAYTRLKQLKFKNNGLVIVG